MTSVKLTSNLFSGMAASSGTENAFATGLNQLTKDLQGGNLSAAQQDWVTFSTDALEAATVPGATTSASGIGTNVLSQVAGSASATSTFVSELNQVGTDLQNGDLSSAQGDMLAADATAMGASPVSTGSGASAATSGTVAKATDNEALIEAIVKAMGAGDTSLVSSGLSQLAASSSSSEGASVLASMSGSSVASSASSSATGQVNQLLQSLTTNSASSSLNLLA